MDKIIPLGERLLSSFADEMGIIDKKIIATKLGFKSEQSIYKIIRGERELNFDALQSFQNYTKRSIDWLLTGEGEKYVNPGKQINLDETFRAVVREIVREEIIGSTELNEKIQGVILAMQSNVENFEKVKTSRKRKKVV